MIPKLSKYPPRPCVPNGSLKDITTLAILSLFQMGPNIRFPNLTRSQGLMAHVSYTSITFAITKRSHDKWPEAEGQKRPNRPLTTCHVLILEQKRPILIDFLTFDSNSTSGWIRCAKNTRVGWEAPHTRGETCTFFHRKKIAILKTYIDVYVLKKVYCAENFISSYGQRLCII